MQSFLPAAAGVTPPNIILRHRRENLKKCSLRGLEIRPDFVFFTYPGALLPDLSNYILLSFDGPLLGPDDAEKGLFILDSTWRYAEKMMRFVDANAAMPKRSLPRLFRTAYPRCQEDCPFPEFGLATVEAIFAAYVALGRDTSGLLDGYHWKNDFLAVNKDLIPDVF